MSQFPTAGGESTVSSDAGSGVVPFDEKNRTVLVEGVSSRLMNEYDRAGTRAGELIVRNEVCATHDGPLYSSCTQAEGSGKIFFLKAFFITLLYLASFTCLQ